MYNGPINSLLPAASKGVDIHGGVGGCVAERGDQSFGY